MIRIILCFFGFCKTEPISEWEDPCPNDFGAVTINRDSGKQIYVRKVKCIYCGYIYEEHN